MEIELNACEKYDNKMDTYLDPVICRNELEKLIIHLYNLYVKDDEYLETKWVNDLVVSDQDFHIYVETGYGVLKLIEIGNFIVSLLYNPTYEEFKWIINTHFSDSTDAITYKLFMAITILEGVDITE